MIRVKEVAQDKGVTKAQIARTSGLSHATVRHYLEPQSRHLRLTILERLAKALIVCRCFLQVSRRI